MFKIKSLDHISHFRTLENQTPLQHAISRHLPVVVEVLCQRNVDMNTMDDTGNCPLWQALDSGQEDIAHTLVSTGHMIKSHGIVICYF